MSIRQREGLVAGRLTIFLLLIVGLVFSPLPTATADDAWPSVAERLFDEEGNPLATTSDYSFDAMQSIRDVIGSRLDGIAPELLDPNSYTGGLPTASVAAYKATTGFEIPFASLLVKGMDWVVEKVPIVKNINSGLKGVAFVAKAIVDKNPAHLGSAGKHFIEAMGLPGRHTIKAIKEMLGVLESLSGFCTAIKEGDRATAFTEFLLAMFDVNKEAKKRISTALRSVVADIDSMDFVNVIRELCGKKHYQVKNILRQKLGGALAKEITDFMLFLAKATDAAIENMEQEQDVGDSRDAGAGAGRSTSPGEDDPPPQESGGQMVPPAPGYQSGPDDGLDGFGSRTD